ncbi:MAG: type IX secretion system membrane protein PorP/SprF [Bacteroidetes bacterium]|nr:type IX secretion system membrane protein PorP/SprF [Bacteroidota bacterium]
MKRRSCFTVILFFASLWTTFAQDPEFSQFYANPLYLNPALTGATICPRIIGNYRNQWPGLGKAYNTYSFSYDQYFGILHGGLGLLVTADRAGGGSLNTTTIGLSYAYMFNITEKLSASLALKGSYYQRRIVWENFVFEDQIDPRSGEVVRPTNEKEPDNPSIIAPDFSAGLFLDYNGLIYGGFAVDHLTQPRNGFYNDNTSHLYMKYTAHAGSVINLKQGYGGDEEKEFSISPNVLYQQQGSFHQLNIGAYLTFDPLVCGLWFRHNFENADALIILAGIHYKNLRVGYSYDLNVSRLFSVSGGAHEVSASWQFPCFERKRKIRAIKCPRF